MAKSQNLYRCYSHPYKRGRNVLDENAWLEKMQPEDFRGLTPLFYGHITPYGEFQLDMNKRINIEGTV